MAGGLWLFCPGCCCCTAWGAKASGGKKESNNFCACCKAKADAAAAKAGEPVEEVHCGIFGTMFCTCWPNEDEQEMDEAVEGHEFGAVAGPVGIPVMAESEKS